MLVGVIGIVAAGIGYLLIVDDGDDGETAASEGSQEGDENGEDGEAEDSAFDPERLTGTWEGTYECPSLGTTGMTLTIDDYGDGTVGAAWAFYPVEGGSGESGMYHMEGTYEDGLLSLEGTDWAEGQQPEGYSMTPLEADLSERTDTELIEGQVVHEQCDTFSVERTNVKPWYDGTWEGEYHCAQGKTGLTLTIEAIATDEAEGVFRFYEVEDSTTEIPDGSFLVAGSYTDRELLLTADDESDWIERPEGYVTVDFLSWAEAPTHPDRLFGVIGPDDPFMDCSLFDLKRVDNPDEVEEDTDEAGSTN